MAFVMVLSSSRQIFLRFFLDARMDSFLRGHVEAFAAFGGFLDGFDDVLRELGRAEVAGLDVAAIAPQLDGRIMGAFVRATKP